MHSKYFSPARTEGFTEASLLELKSINTHTHHYYRDAYLPYLLGIVDSALENKKTSKADEAHEMRRIQVMSKQPVTHRTLTNQLVRIAARRTSERTESQQIVMNLCCPEFMRLSVGRSLMSPLLIVYACLPKRSNLNLLPLIRPNFTPPLWNSPSVTMVLWERKSPEGLAPSPHSLGVSDLPNVSLLAFLPVFQINSKGSSVREEDNTCLVHPGLGFDLQH